MQNNPQNNPILEKNLECIEKYNPKLKEDLLNLKSLTNQIELVETELKEPNLLYNKIPLHSQFGAEQEAKKIFAQAPNNPSSMHVIFGMGLGHLFKEFCEQSKGRVILYEPDLEILRVVFELVDFSKELSQDNIRIASDMGTFKSIFSSGYTYKANATFAFLDSYREIYGEYINEIFSQIEVIKGICLADYNTLKRCAAGSISMMLKNLPYTLEQTPLIEFKDIYKGKTALIVSAGPSLDQNIKIIKENRNKVIIFCVGTALKALVKNGIIPDFLNIIEINDVSGQVDGIDLSDINLILEPYTNNVFHKMKMRKKILFPTNASHANNSWAKITGVDIAPYKAKGTVSYAALYSAKIMGFEKIILVGQDLAYANNQCYSKDSAYPELGYQINPETNKIEVQIQNYGNYVRSLIPENIKGMDEEYKTYANYKVQNLNETLYYVKGINGEMLPTQGGYATFIEHFREFASQNPDMNLINSSMIGAEIKGFKNLPLGVALENVTSIKDKPDIDNINFSYDINIILCRLENEKKHLETALKEINNSKDYMHKYEREFSRYKSLTTDLMKYFRAILELYNSLISKNKLDNHLYQALAFSAGIEVEYLLKNSENVTLENIQQIYNSLKDYFGEVEQNLVEIIKLLDEKKMSLEESNSCMKIS